MLFFQLLVGCLASNTLSIEPPFWFIGLKNKELQVFIHGDNVKSAKVSLSTSAISLKEAATVDSSNYLILYLDISRASVGTFQIILSLNSIETRIDYELKPKRASRPRTFDSSDVVYLIMPDRFSNGNPDLDDIPMTKEYKIDRSDPNARHGGDLFGIEKHLDYLHDLGITAIWMTPVIENDNTGGCYHGYAATNMYMIDKRFGSNEDYIRLIQKAHEKGIKIIYDIVFNHISNEHVWMVDVPSNDFFNNKEKYIQTQHDKSVSYSPYASKYDTNVMMTGWFVPSMPDLNQRNRHVIRYLIQNSIWWIEYADIDGYRQDTYPYAFPEAMEAWTTEITNEYPDFNIVGESWIGSPIGTSYWQKGSPLNKGNTGLKSVMDFHFLDISRQVFYDENQFYTLHDHMGYDVVYANISSVMRFIENHDTDRFYKTKPTDIKPLKQAMTVLLTITGIPQIYYGTEVLMYGEKSQSDGYVRKDFPGGWDGDTSNWFTAEGRSALQNEAFDFIRKLLNFRKNNEVISK